MYRVEIGFGIGFDKNGVPIRKIDAEVDDFIHRASRRFGGVAAIKVNGGWVNGQGDMVNEPGMILRIDGIQTDKDMASAKQFALAVKDALNQESVVFSVSQVETEFL